MNKLLVSFDVPGQPPSKFILSQLSRSNQLSFRNLILHSFKEEATN